MYREILEKIQAEQPVYGTIPQPPCTQEQVEALRERARVELGDEIPAPYIDFLLLSNGLDWNGLLIYAAETTSTRGQRETTIEGFVPANLDHRDVEDMRELLVFGVSGMELYVHDTRAGEYRILDTVSLDPYESFAGFDAMMAEVLRTRM